MASTSNAFLGLLHASELECGSTEGLVSRCSVADLVGGSHVDSQNSRGAVAVSGPRKEVSREDVARATEAAARLPREGG